MQNYSTPLLHVVKKDEDIKFVIPKPALNLQLKLAPNLTPRCITFTPYSKNEYEMQYLSLKYDN